MKKISLLMLSLILLGGTMILSPSFSSGSPFNYTYLDPGYTAFEFLTAPKPFISIAFDADKNLYTEWREDFGQGTAYIRELYAATGYSTNSLYASYTTTENGISGLNFGGTNLNVAEISADLNSGLIRRIDTNSKTIISTVDLPNFRPTGITNDSAGIIYFPGRKASDVNFGNIYKLDLSNNLTIVKGNDNFVATGIAYNAGDLFVSKPNNSIYMFPLSNPTAIPSLIATFNDGIEELTFDQEGNLYVLEGYPTNTGDLQKIFKLTKVPEPSLMVLLGISVLSLAGLKRWWRE